MNYKDLRKKNKQKGFTLVEVIVVLVILAILATIMIPAMTGWIDKANKRQLIATCRACVTAAQTLASEAYGVDESKTPPEGAAVIELAGVDGIVSDISLDAAGCAVDTLSYSKGAASVTYKRLPSVQYIFGTGIPGITASVWEWANAYVYADDPEHKKSAYLTMDYSKENPKPLTKAQTAEIFGDLQLKEETQYIYPMAIKDKNGELLNIQYVTHQNPTAKGVSGDNRYVPNALIINGEVYICNRRTADGKVNPPINGCAGGLSFQKLMNNEKFESEQEFINLITGAGGYYVAA